MHMKIIVYTLHSGMMWFRAISDTIYIIIMVIKAGPVSPTLIFPQMFSSRKPVVVSMISGMMQIYLIPSPTICMAVG